MPDPRINRTKKYPITEVLFIALCAMLAGAEDFVTFAAFGRAKEAWFRERLELQHGIPSHDTFRRVFALMDPKAFQDRFLTWVASLREMNDQLPHEEDVLAMDGKKLRHSFDTASGKSAIHMVSVWSSQAGLVLGQVKVDEKSNEIKAIPRLLDVLDIAGRLVTIDAMGCQKAIAAKIVAKGGGWVFGLKGNQGGMLEACTLFFEHALEQKFADVLCREYTTLEKDHGRIETRHYYLLDLPNGLAWGDERRLWCGLSSLGVVESTRQVGEKTSFERRYYITTLEAAPQGSAQRFARACRGHWGIENSVHWSLDISFNEDACRVRMGHAAENLATLRHICLNLLRKDATAKMGIRNRRLRAGWDMDYMEHILQRVLEI